MASSNKLFEPLQVGNCKLSNRLVMAPLTRFRADDNHVPVPMMETYYAQRGCVAGTLLISEATFISPAASGFPNAPGIWSAEQIAAWRKVTDAVHKKGSFIFCQLWALGRAANPDNLKRKGYNIVSSSNIAMPVVPGQRVPNPATPKQLNEQEVWEYVEMYAQAARNAVDAGFDGVEIHAANGYLVDQFTQDTCNKREDAWGGSVKKRSRFAIEVASAVAKAIGATRTGIRLSPYSTFQGMLMEDPRPQFSYLTKMLKELKLAYLHVVESRISGNADVESTQKVDFMIDIWSNVSPVLLAGGFKAASAAVAVNDEYQEKDIAIVFGRLFISNPDLVFRMREGIDLQRYVRQTFYKVKSEIGYTDYPFSEEFRASRPKL